MPSSAVGCSLSRTALRRASHVHRMDAELLANILRNDRKAHRPLPAYSELVQAIGVVARA